MENLICYKIRMIATMLHLSAETPEQILRVMKIFRDLLSDDSNFIDPDKWGYELDGKEVIPFSFSKMGLSKVESLKNKYSEFQHAYMSGTAGIKDQHYSLIYFLSQFLVAITSYVDSLPGKKPKNEEEKDILERIRDKYKKIDFRVNTLKLYNKIPERAHSEEEYRKAKQYLLEIIGNVEKDYKELEDLTEKEKEIILRH